MVLVHPQESAKSLPYKNMFINKTEQLITVTENGELFFFFKLVLKVSEAEDKISRVSCNSELFQ